jgi:hypothetical protein
VVAVTIRDIRLHTEAADIHLHTEAADIHLHTEAADIRLHTEAADILIGAVSIIRPNLCGDSLLGGQSRANHRGVL